MANKPEGQPHGWAMGRHGQRAGAGGAGGAGDRRLVGFACRPVVGCIHALLVAGLKVGCGWAWPRPQAAVAGGLRLAQVGARHPGGYKIFEGTVQHERAGTQQQQAAAATAQARANDATTTHGWVVGGCGHRRPWSWVSLVRLVAWRLRFTLTLYTKPKRTLAGLGCHCCRLCLTPSWCSSRGCGTTWNGSRQLPTLPPPSLPPSTPLQALIDSFLGRFQGVRDYLEQVKTAARAEGCVRTLAGRARPIRGLNSTDKR